MSRATPPRGQGELRPIKQATPGLLVRVGRILGGVIDWLMVRPGVASFVRSAPSVAWFVDADEIERRLRLRAQPVRLAAAKKDFPNYANSAETVKLHLGCGPRVLSGWLNVDLEFNPEWRSDYPDTDERGGSSDFVALDIVTDGLPWPDASVDVIYHEDFIEHLSQRDAICLLAETFRVMKPGAVQRITTPDLSTSMRTGSHFELGSAGVYTDEWDQWHHLNVFSQPSLDEVCRLVGFSRVEWNRKDGSACPEMPRDYRPGPGSRPSEGNLFVDLTR